MSNKLIQGAGYGLEAARWNYFPTPSVSMSHSGNNMQTVFSLSQPIWTGGKLSSATRTAKIESQRAIYAKDEQVYNLIANYFTALSTYLVAQEKITVLNNNRQQLTELMQMLSRMVNAGVASNVDKTLLRSKVSAIYSDLTITKARRNAAKIQLELLTSKKITCTIKFDYDGLDHAGKINPTTPLAVLVDDLKSTHPVLRVEAKNIALAQEAVKLANAQIYPNLMLVAEHKRGSLRNPLVGDDNIIYLTFSASIGAGLSSLTNIDKAKVAVWQAQFEKDAKTKLLVDQLIIMHIDFVSFKTHSKIVHKNIITINKVYQSYKRQFLANKKQWVEVVNVLAELNAAKITATQLDTKAKLLEYKIALLSGRLDLNDL